MRERTAGRLIACLLTVAMLVGLVPPVGLTAAPDGPVPAVVGAGSGEPTRASTSPTAGEESEAPAAGKDRKPERKARPADAGHDRGKARGKDRGKDHGKSRGKDQGKNKSKDRGDDPRAGADPAAVDDTITTAEDTPFAASTVLLNDAEIWACATRGQHLKADGGKHKKAHGEKHKKDNRGQDKKTGGALRPVADPATCGKKELAVNLYNVQDPIRVCVQSGDQKIHLLSSTSSGQPGGCSPRKETLLEIPGEAPTKLCLGPGHRQKYRNGRRAGPGQRHQGQRMLKLCADNPAPDLIVPARNGPPVPPTPPDPPVPPAAVDAVDDAGAGFGTDEDTPFTTGNVLTNDTDPEGDPLSVVALDTSSTKGAVTDNGDGSFAYDPNGQFEVLNDGETATDTFTYTAGDGQGGADTAAVTIAIAGISDSPDAVDDAGAGFGADEDNSFTTASVLTNDTDPNGDALAVTAVDTTGTLGEVIDNGDGTFAYDPNGQFEALAEGESDSDRFDYTVSNGHGGTDTATVTIAIAGVNDSPDAVDDTATTDEETVQPIPVLANDSDPDASDTLTVLDVDTTGTAGAVTNEATRVVYDPNGQFGDLAAGATATDTFTYTVGDGHGGTDTATVTVTITGINDAPDAVDDAGAGFGTDEDTSLTTGNVLANDSDPNGDPLAVGGLDTTGAQGEVTDNGDGTFNYSPNGQFEDLGSGESATDTFAYTVRDGLGGEATATVTIAIAGVNDAPNAGDDDGAGFGTDAASSFTTGNVLANDTDADGDTLTVAGLDLTGAKGQVSDNGDGTFDYDPNGQFEDLGSGESATDTFAYTASDGHGGTDTAIVTIAIQGVNGDPVAGDDAGVGFGTDEDAQFTTASLLANDTDPDAADTLGVTNIDRAATTGQVQNNGDGTVEYDPNGMFEHLAASESATDTFGYTASDGHGGADTATVTIAIAGVNDAPTAANDTATTGERAATTIDLLANDTDPDQSDVLSVSTIDDTGTLGQVTDNGDGTVDYDPNGQFDTLTDGQTATDTFAYTAADGHGGADTATVTVTITGVTNLPPIAVDDAGAGFGADEDTPFTTASVLLNDSDPDGDLLAVSAVDTTGTLGEVIDNGDGTFAYDPNGQFEALAEGESATDTFAYTVSDGNGGTDSATVTITIAGVNDGPDAVDDTTTTDKSTVTTIDLLANDSDPDASDTLSVGSIDSSGTLGEVTDNGDGTVDYDPNGQFDTLGEGQSASDSFTYTVGDGHGGTDTATVTVTITGINDAPDAVDDAGAGFGTDEDTSFTTGNVLANDSDPNGDPLAVADLDTTGAQGEVTDNGDGTFNYSPNGQFDALPAGGADTDSFTYTVGDGHGGTDTATVTIAIAGVNDSPNAVDDAAATDEATALPIAVLANDSDPENDALSVAAVATDNGTPGDTSDDTQGTVTIAGGGSSVTYDPNGAFVGLDDNESATDSFSYTADDGNGGSDTATVTVTITGISNVPPTISDIGDQTIAEDGATTALAVTVDDPDGDENAIVLSAASDNQALAPDATAFAFGGSGPNRTVTVTPAADQFGTATITVSATDAGGATVSDSFVLTVTAVADPPQATNATTDEDTQTTSGLVVTPNAADGAEVTHFKVTAITNGTLFQNDGVAAIANDVFITAAEGAAGLRFTPALNLNSPSSSFGFTVQGATSGAGDGLSAGTGAVITVSAVNDDPAISDVGNQSTDEDVATGAIAFTVGDVEDAAGSLAVTGSSSDTTLVPNGNIVIGGSGANRTVTVTPADNQFGTATITLTVTDAGNATDSDDFVLTVNPVNDAPTGVDNESHAVTGNVRIQVSAANGQLLDGVTDPEGDAFTVEVAASSTHVGDVVINPDGSYIYNPKAGRTGADTVQFRVCDDETPRACSATFDLTLNVADMLWFVDNNQPSNGTGRLTDPFNSIANFVAVNNGTGDNPAAGEVVFVDRQTATSYTGPLALLNNQKVLGKGASVGIASFAGITLAPDSDTLPSTNGTDPVIATSVAATNGITLANGNTLQGLSVGNTTGSDIAGANFGTLTVAEISLTGTGQALNLTTGTLAGTFDTVISISGTNGIALTGVAGTPTFTAGSLSGATGATLLVSGGSVSFTWPGNITQASNAPLLSAGGGHTGTLTFQTGTLSATNGAGLQFNDADGTASYTFNGPTTLNGGDAGIDITNGSSGAFSFGTGVVITNPSGTAFTLNGSNANVTYSGGMSKSNAGLLVDVTNQTGGTVTFQTGTLSATAGTGIQLSNADGAVNFNGATTLNGGDAGVDVVGGSAGTISFGANAAITNPTNQAIVISASAPTFTYAGALTKTNNSNTGILAQNNTGGTILFSGATKTLSTGAGTAVNLATNGGATISFTNGGLDIDTTSGAGFSATGGGAVTVTTGANPNTIDSGTGTALNVANTTIGANGLTFRRISATGATNGIVLNTTGSSGGLTITGNSSGLCGGAVSAGPPASAAVATAPNAADCTGGTILNSTGAGVALTNTANVSLTRLRVSGSGSDGISGTNVTDFTLISSLIEGNGNAVRELNLDFGDASSLTPNGLHGAGAITNSTIRNAFEGNVAVRNFGGAALTAFAVTGSQFSNISANSQSDDGMLIEASSTANMTVSVTDSYFAANRGDHFQAAALNAGTMNVTFRHNTLAGGHATALGQGVTINAATQNPAYSGRIDYDIDGNHINGAISNGIIVNLGSSGSAAIFDGFIRNNIIGTPGPGSALSCSVQANGIGVDAHGNGTHTSQVSGNVMRNCFDRGILVLANDGNGVLNLTITGNDIKEMSTDPNGGREAINIVAGATSTNIFGLVDSHIACLNITSADGNTVGGPQKNGDIRMRQRFQTRVILPGYTGAAFDTAAVIALLQANNPGTTATATTNDDATVTTDGYFGGGPCTLPTL